MTLRDQVGSSDSAELRLCWSLIVRFSLAGNLLRDLMGVVALVTLHQVEFDLFSIMEALEALTHDLTVVHEDVLFDAIGQ